MLKAGAGLYLEDSDTTPETLLNMLSELTKDSEKLSSIQNAALSLAKYDGIQKIIEQIKE